MFKRIKRILGFPYPRKLELQYMHYLVKRLYKPLLFLLAGVLLFAGALLFIDFYAPDSMAPPDYLPTMVLMHLALFAFTLITFFLSILLRRQVLKYPALYFVLLYGYAAGICIWGSTLAAYADYVGVMHTAFGYVSLILAVVLTLKPWQSILFFSGNCAYYFFLLLEVFPGREQVLETLSNAVMASLFSIIISITIFNLRLRTFYSNLQVEEKLKHINEINEDLLERVHIDGLSGLRNRRFFDEILPIKINELRKGSNVICGIIFDIDKFKDYNDWYGHQAGDSCLRAVATLVDETLSARDTYLVRYGGEEFFVLAAVPNVTSAEKLAERIRSTVEDARIEHLAAERGIVTVSIGVATLSDDEDLEVLTKNADQALYSAKRQGRNQVVLHQESRARTV